MRLASAPAACKRNELPPRVANAVTHLLQGMTEKDLKTLNMKAIKLFISSRLKINYSSDALYRHVLDVLDKL